MEIEEQDDEIPLLGLRVVRGPSWEWDDQDNSEGNVGTVIEVGRSGSRTPDKTVVVQWDCGTRTNYRVGYGGAHDLLVLDSSPAGVKHNDRTCHGCNRQGIRGTRYRCMECSNCDLCTKCYMTNKHNIHHKFKRYDNAKSSGRALSSRYGQPTTQSVGLYPGARVVRGYHWEWNDQDGGKGRIGTITKLCEVDGTETGATVQWDTGRVNQYRVGHKGKVDLRYQQPGRGIPYYKNHLMACHASRCLPSDTQLPPKCRFKIGDPVMVTLLPEIVKQMQEDHGGWSSNMRDLIGKKGYVHRITTHNDVRVQYRPSDLGNSLSREECRWTLNPDALQLVPDEPASASSPPTSLPPASSFPSTVNPIMSSQSRGFSDDFVQLSPQIVQISEVHTPPLIHHNDATICVEERSERVDVSAVSNQVSSAHSSEVKSPLLHWLRHGGDDVNTLQLLHLWQDQFEKCDEGGYNALHYAALHGMPRVLQEIVRRRSDLVNAKTTNGMTPLHLGASQGHVNVVKILLENSSDPNLLNENSESALFLACKKLHMEVVEVLISATANNVAVFQSYFECLDLKESPPFVISDELCDNSAWSKVKSCLTKHSLLSPDGSVRKSFALACFLVANGAKPSSNVTQQLSTDAEVNCLLECGQRETKSDHKICLLCEDLFATVLFQPCGHVVSCTECARRSKKCFECKEPIHSKSIDGKDLPATSNAEEMLENVNEEKNCIICMERHKDTVFVGCGHMACNECAKQLKHQQCHICRKKVEKFQRFYE